MDKSNKLIFFNKEGYPYNFIYNEIEKKWDGKLIFDENSSELFKTIGLYIFEKVDPLNFNSIFDFQSSQLFNWSGISFIEKTYENEHILNIEKVNNDEHFYTKWIYGKDFDSKFKKGSVISFSGDTNIFNNNHWDDFINDSDVYFNVLGTKKDAILISTFTNNLNFNNFTFDTGLTLNSHNIIKVCDYGNQYLVDFNNLNYYNNKKLTIVNSEYNDGIKTYKNYNILKTKIYDFILPMVISEKSQIILELTLFTERPKLYSGSIIIENVDDFNTSITFNDYINYNIDFFNTGQTLIFEKYDGYGLDNTNPIFTIKGHKDRDLLLTENLEFKIINNRNYIIINNPELTGLTFNDQIYLEAFPFLSGLTNHNERSFSIIEITDYYIEMSNSMGIKIEVDQYVSNEEGNLYRLYKKLKRSKIKTIYTEPSNTINYIGDLNCFSTTNKILISQEILPNNDSNIIYFYENTVNALNIKYKSFLNNYGVNLFHYFSNNKELLVVESLYDYNYNPYFDIKIKLIDNINDNYLNIDNNFTFTTGFTNTDIYYFEIYEQLQNEKISLYETNNLNKNFKSQISLDLNNDLVNYGFKVNLNDNEYFINYRNNTEDTINDFIYKYTDIFNKLGLILYSGYTNGYILNIDSIYPNVEIIDLDVFVNLYSNYNISKTFNKGVVISSNELKSIYNNLYDLELSTGMIISINGSNYTLNNKDYNIIGITNDTIQLSYQGPFFDDYNIDADIYVKEFIRKPRSYYNKVIDYKFSWINPDFGNITNDIFFYDLSGEQLKPYNDISELKYMGIKPLYNANDNIYLNKDPNRNESDIYNPSAQQTVFNDITHKLDMLNESYSYNYVPIPLELFIGFNSKNEGVSYKEMKLEKIEYVLFTGCTQNNTLNDYQKHFIIENNIINFITDDILFNFSDYGFDVDQLIEIKFIDTSLTNQMLYEGYKIYRIKYLTNNKIFIDSNYSGDLPNFNTLDLLDISGKTFNYVIETKPKILLDCKIFGQTEVEDLRYDINLRNLGINIYKEAEFIFKESDIDEHSVDFSRLNRKRKEMLTIYNDIFNYIGAYKSLIHSIDYFGYNDLQLYEYYRNIKQDSPLFGKLHKILIDNIFDNNIDGWESIDYIKNKYDKGYYKKTNLFNLTYRITDVYGNYSLQYSLNDVQIKLMSLVKWLRKNIIPLSSNIKDITGICDTTNTIVVRHDSSNFVSKSIVDNIVVAVNFYYTITRINQNNYLISISFYVLDGYDKPNYFNVKIVTYSLNEITNELIPQQNLLIYKTDYNEYSFNLNSSIDEFISIETTSYNGYGAGYTNSKMFKYNIGKNFYLINSNFNATSFPYLNTDDGYYILDDGRYYIIKY